MRNRIAFVLAAILIAAGFFALPPAPAVAQSQSLVNVLNEIQNLSNHDFNRLVTWSRNWAPAPPNTSGSLHQTERDIRNLGSDDRNAIFFWLGGLGRSALYARGANDAQIGFRNPGGPGPSPTATPNAWRNLPLATASLDGTTQGNIQILGGFAAAKRDGTAAIACVSFQNLAAKTANDVVFEFPLMTDGGTELGKLTLDRRGEFSPNIGIYSYGTMNDWQQGQPPSSRKQNCIQRTLGTAAIPILEARIAGYRVVKVTYDDGTSWP